MEIVSFAQYGYEGEIVKIGADLRRGIPAIDIVGLPDGAIREARERMRAAIRNSGFEFPRERILINLSPASLKKEGSGFDLSIALAVLVAAGASPANAAIICRVMVLGELELSGTVRPVRGILPAVSKGLSGGINWYIVPEENKEEAQILRNARVIGVKNLAEALHSMQRVEPDNEKLIPRSDTAVPDKNSPYSVVWPPSETSYPGYEDIRGQARLVRALEIAAAGGHNLIAYGPPGSGKTLALRRFPSILPNLDRETAITVTRIHSLAENSGLFIEGNRLALRPPFREPHQSASLEGMTGGGRNCHPGEISLAHGGTLFLDEAAQFRSSVLQALRSPLETGMVTVSRAGRTDTFPARFQLLMAVNPCPCGNFGRRGKVCTCTPEMIERYWKRMTAPLLDRIDLRINMEEPDARELAGPSVFSTAELRKKIGQARLIQRNRNASGEEASPGWSSFLNAHIDASRIGTQCKLTPEVASVFAKRMEAANLSGRGGHSILKTARTIADLEGQESIGEEHILEAIQFRTWSGMLPDFL